MKRVAISMVAVATIIFSACDNAFKRPDTSGISLNIEVKPFYKDLLAVDADSVELGIANLQSKYGNYFSDYCEYELRIGNPTDEDFAANFERFISYKENNEVLATCDSVFGELSNLNSELTDAFKCFKYYFPEIITPEVYSHFSGFNNKIFVDSTYLSFSLEHYLGSDCRYYVWLEFPVYAAQNKNPENIASDLMKAWIYANYPDMSEKEDVLSAMVYQGKVLYALKKCMPDLSDERLFNMNRQQLKWCKNSEPMMWGYLAEQKLLYSTNPLDMKKLIDEAPFTAFFGNNSPGRASLYCGFNIVSGYMANNPQTTLIELFATANAQKILSEARYRP